MHVITIPVFQASPYGLNTVPYALPYSSLLYCRWIDQPRNCLRFVQAEFAAVKDGNASLSHFRSEISDLNKFAVLNYIAVIKACKKRNRHLQVLTLRYATKCVQSAPEEGSCCLL